MANMTKITITEADGEVTNMECDLYLLVTVRSIKDEGINVTVSCPSNGLIKAIMLRAALKHLLED
jgi:hypothetical protein